MTLLKAYRMASKPRQCLKPDFKVFFASVLGVILVKLAPVKSVSSLIH